MQRWEYKVLSLADGTYTETLNAYGRAGWELVAVAPDVGQVPAAREEGGGLPVPVPRALGAIEQAGRRLTKSAAADPDEPQPGAVFTTLLWVLRRPLPDDDGEFEFES
jgi:hypothetical protein